MSDKRDCVLIGYSGHGYVVTDIALSCQYVVTYYSDKNEVVRNPYQLRYAGCEQTEHFIGWNKGYHFLLGIGDNKIREKIARIIEARSESILTLIHPTAAVSSTALIGKGVVAAPNVSINALVQVEAFAILNTGCIIEHECRVGTASHIAPGAVLTGNVCVGNQTFVGANSVIRQELTIGNNVIIGAGSVVLRDIPDNEIWVGNPARKIRNNH